MGLKWGKVWKWLMSNINVGYTGARAEVDPAVAKLRRGKVNADSGSADRERRSMTQAQKSLFINIISVRYEVDRAIVDFIMLPGRIQIAMPVLTPPVERRESAILRYAWGSLSYYLAAWSEVAKYKGEDSSYHVLWEEQ